MADPEAPRNGRWATAALAWVAASGVAAWIVARPWATALHASCTLLLVASAAWHGGKRRGDAARRMTGISLLVATLVAAVSGAAGSGVVGDGSPALVLVHAAFGLALVAAWVLHVPAEQRLPGSTALIALGGASFLLAALWPDAWRPWQVAAWAVLLALGAFGFERASVAQAPAQ